MYIQVSRKNAGKLNVCKFLKKVFFSTKNLIIKEKYYILYIVMAFGKSGDEMNFVESKQLVYEYTIYNETEDKTEKQRALNNVSISIPKGQFVAILGHNGSGKSTFAKHINALITPTKGIVFVNGLDTSEVKNTWEVRQSAGMVFQNPDNQLIATIVEEDVAFGPENLGIPSEEIRQRVDTALKTVSMEEFRHSSPSLLSGGQKQRVAIAGILAMKPQCIVLDEPTAMLDPMGRREVVDTIINLNKTEGITVVLITHYMEEAALADRVIVMEKGQVVMDDAPNEIFPRVEEMKKLHLDVPQATELMHILNKKGITLNEKVLTIDEAIDEIVKHGFKNDNGYTGSSRPKKELKTGTPIIEVKNITHIYGKESTFEKVALKDVSLTINKGEFIGLIGHTGSGKSTLIQHLNGLVKPDSGVVLVNGEDINDGKKRLKSLRQKVGLVFQYPEHQLFESTIYKDVAFGAKNLGLAGEELDKRVRESLALVGMDENFYEKSPFELSGGQKRRVAIAGVLAMNPSVLILDEPAAGLDPYSKEEILTNIKEMHEKLGITVVLVSHSMEDISKLADRILVMNRGSVEMFDTVERVFAKSKRLEEIGLAAPQINTIFNRLADKGLKLPDDVYTVEEAAEILSHILR